MPSQGQQALFHSDKVRPEMQRRISGEQGCGHGPASTTRLAEREMPTAVCQRLAGRPKVQSTELLLCSLALVGRHRFWPGGRGAPHWRKFVKDRGGSSWGGSSAASLIGLLSPFEIFSPTKDIKRMLCFAISAM